MNKEWENFNKGNWCETIDVRDFINKNYTYYEGNESFLENATNKTQNVWNKCEELLKEELKKGVYINKYEIEDFMESIEKYITYLTQYVEISYNKA